MRYIALLLLAANVAFFLYGEFGPQPQAPRPQLAASKGVDSLILVSERETSTSSRTLEAAIANPVPAEDINTCLGLGPFTSVTQSQSFQSRLAAIGFESSIQIIDSETDEFDYRVMLPPHASAEEAFRRLRELQGRGIDSYVITQGRDALGISMGVFSERSAANRIKRELAAEGYNTVISDIPQIAREYWLMPEADGNLFEPAVLDLLAENHPELRAVFEGCQPLSGNDG